MLSRLNGAGYLSAIEISTPASEPVTLAEFKAHARISGTSEDADLTVKLLAARIRVEDLISSPLITRSFRLRLDSFPIALNAIILPHYPVSAVTLVEYFYNATWNTLANTAYTLDSDSSPSRVMLAYSATWPTVDTGAVNLSPGVRVTYSAGWANAATVPSTLKMAVLMLATYWYANRETADVLNLTEVPQACDILCASYKRTRWLI